MSSQHTTVTENKSTQPGLAEKITLHVEKVNSDAQVEIRFEELERQQTTNYEITAIFDEGIKKLVQVNKNKSQIINDIARDLEGKIRTNEIVNEIVHRLCDPSIKEIDVSERLIRYCLNEKYKNKRQSENAKKQGKVPEVEPPTQVDRMAAKKPLCYCKKPFFLVSKVHRY
ncbi:MAG: hypothetical protein WBZ36_10555 [Candidatus Nitrosopolaris sp.]